MTHKESLASHLLELRSRLIRILICFGFLALIGIPFSSDIYTFAASPLLEILPSGSSMITAYGQRHLHRTFGRSIVRHIGSAVHIHCDLFSLTTRRTYCSEPHRYHAYCRSRSTLVAFTVRWSSVGFELPSKTAFIGMCRYRYCSTYEHQRRKRLIRSKSTHDW